MGRRGCFTLIESVNLHGILPALIWSEKGQLIILLTLEVIDLDHCIQNSNFADLPSFHLEAHLFFHASYTTCEIG